jgi:hypothetical protein
MSGEPFVSWTLTNLRPSTIAILYPLFKMEYAILVIKILFLYKLSSAFIFLQTLIVSQLPIFFIISPFPCFLPILLRHGLAQRTHEVVILFPSAIIVAPSQVPSSLLRAGPGVAPPPWILASLLTAGPGVAARCGSL